MFLIGPLGLCFRRPRSARRARSSWTSFECDGARSGLVTKVIRPGNATAEAATEANRAMVPSVAVWSVHDMMFD